MAMVPETSGTFRVFAPWFTIPGLYRVLAGDVSGPPDPSPIYHDPINVKTWIHLLVFGNTSGTETTRVLDLW